MKLTSALSQEYRGSVPPLPESWALDAGPYSQLVDEFVAVSRNLNLYEAKPSPVLLVVAVKLLTW